MRAGEARELFGRGAQPASHRVPPARRSARANPHGMLGTCVAGRAGAPRGSAVERAAPRCSEIIEDLVMATPTASLIRHQLADGNPFFTPKGARLDVAKVGREVAEYFATGIELKKGDVVFDVGANVGLFALHAANHTDGDVSLYCFEPIPDIYGALSANFERHPALQRTRHRRSEERRVGKEASARGAARH